MVTLAHLTEKAQQAHYWISFSPERRGEQLIKDAEQELNADLQELPEHARSRYAARYEVYLTAWIGAKSNCASSMITGPARFNVRRAEKANNREQAAYQRLQDYRRRAKKAILRAERPPVTVASELEEARQKLKFKELLQDEMKRINSAHAKYQKNPANFDFTGFSNDQRQLIAGYVPAYSWEPHPFAPYQLKNNNAEIRRLKLRVAELEAKHERQQVAPLQTSASGNGWELIANHAADRWQILFTEKPGDNVRSFLKKHGFKWAPSAQAWQRKIADSGRFSILHYVIPFLLEQYNEQL